MRFALAFVVVCLALTLALPQAAAQDKIELFGGYSWVHASAPVTYAIACPAGICPITTSTYHPNLNGWELAGTYKPGSWFGITADFSQHYGSVGSSSTHLTTYLFGPKVSLPGPISPFVHVLAGGAYESIGAGIPSSGRITLPTSGSAFAAVLGVGIDIKVFPFVSIRPIQIDYLFTHFNSSGQNQPRVSAGLVFHF